MTGPLARRIAELEGELGQTRDGLTTQLRIHFRLLTQMYEALELAPDDGEQCVPGCEEGPQGSEHYLWHIIQQHDEALAEVERLHSWAGLMELLDEHWPADIWPMLEDDRKADAGHRVTSAMRWIDRLRTERDEALAEVERLRKENSDWVPKFEGMRPTGNGLELTTTEAHEVLLGMTEAMATALGDAENYIEAEVQAAGEPRYIFTVRRYGKPTPHELRRRAEAERDQLLERAVRYAHALTAVAHPEPAHVDCDVSKYSACEAARWLAERAP